VKVAALQMQPTGSVAGNLAAIARAARAAAQFGAQLLVTPEMGVTGYAILDQIAGLAEPADGEMMATLSDISKSEDIALVAGFPERAGNIVYNSAALIQPDGGKTIYRKCHLFGPLEKAAFTPADALSDIVTIGGIKAGMVICYDIEFPEYVRSLVLAGAELVIAPTALPRNASAKLVSETMIPIRAFENHVFVIYAGLCGEEHGTPYQGGTAIAGPDGEFLARAGSSETLLIADLNPSYYATLELDPYLEDRRAGLYKV
jgi:predicted amidohydrolase